MIEQEEERGESAEENDSNSKMSPEEKEETDDKLKSISNKSVDENKEDILDRLHATNVPVADRRSEAKSSAKSSPGKQSEAKSLSENQGNIKNAKFTSEARKERSQSKSQQEMLTEGHNQEDNSEDEEFNRIMEPETLETNNQVKFLV